MYLDVSHRNYANNLLTPRKEMMQNAMKAYLPLTEMRITIYTYERATQEFAVSQGTLVLTLLECRNQIVSVSRVRPIEL